VLLDPVLDDLRAVPDVAQVGVDPLNHLVGPMAELAGDGVDRHRSAPVERLQPGGAVRVAEGIRAKLAGAETRALCDPIEEPVDVLEPPLALRGPRGKEQGAPALEPWAEHPRPEDRLELGPERDHPVRRAGLEGTPAVRPAG
jgi:hypothetical protein